MAAKETYPCYVKVCAGEGTETVELPTDKQGHMMIETIQGQFPYAVGLRYRGSSGVWRGVAVVEEGRGLQPPIEGWGDSVFHIVKDLKKREEAQREAEQKKFKSGSNNTPVDLVVKGLLPTTTLKIIDKYFSEFGPLSFYEVKTDPMTGNCRGFAFIKFRTKATERKVLEQKAHVINGKRCEVSLTRKTVDEKCAKVFIGRLPESITEEALEKFFSPFGNIIDVYIPKPFKSFGFVTFENGDDANTVMETEHTMDDIVLNVSTASTKRRDNKKRRRSEGEDFPGNMPPMGMANNNQAMGNFPRHNNFQGPNNFNNQAPNNFNNQAPNNFNNQAPNNFNNQAPNNFNNQAPNNFNNQAPNNFNNQAPNNNFNNQAGNFNNQTMGGNNFNNQQQMGYAGFTDHNMMQQYLQYKQQYGHLYQNMAMQQYQNHMHQYNQNFATQKQNNQQIPNNNQQIPNNSQQIPNNQNNSNDNFQQMGKNNQQTSNQQIGNNQQISSNAQISKPAQVNNNLSSKVIAPPSKAASSSQTKPPSKPPQRIPVLSTPTWS